VAHDSHKRDQAGFLRRGGSTLFPEEIELLGDVAGRRLVHLQCNAGQDTLSLAKLGAIVTGVDISDEAVRLAKELSTESGIPATFHRADLFDWFDAAREKDERFDIAFCSYGSVCWISNLQRWAEGISTVLAPGGRFVIVDFHPVSMMFNERFELTYPYFGEGKPFKWDDGVEDYVAAAGPALAPSGFQEGVRDFKNPHTVYEFPWHIAAILTALLESGLRIEQFREYPYSNGGKLFDNMREQPGRRMYPPDSLPSLPLMYGITALKPNLVTM
jgi:SAM-dependent methyltransferase